MKCSNCSYDNPDTAKYCRSCGFPLTDQQLCKNGHVIPSDANGVCPVCPSSSKTPTVAVAPQVGGKQRTVAVAPPAGAGHGGGPVKGKTVVVGPPGSQTPSPSPMPMGGGAPGSAAKKKTVIMSPGGSSTTPNPAVSNRRLVGFLVTFDLQPTGDFFVLREGNTRIGRDTEMDIVIPTERAAISGEHARILARGGKLYLRDEMSANGTMVNGEDAAPGDTIVLNDGDTIRFGDLDTVLRTVNPPDTSS